MNIKVIIENEKISIFLSGNPKNQIVFTISFLELITIKIK